MASELNHGHKKGEKLLYGRTEAMECYVTYLGYSNLDDACFIGEDSYGDVSDDWLWEEIVEEE